MKVSEVTDKIEHLEKMLLSHFNSNVLTKKEIDDAGVVYDAECVSFSISAKMTNANLQCVECGKITTLIYTHIDGVETIEFRTKNVEKNDN